jgi:outer membrane protein
MKNLKMMAILAAVGLTLSVGNVAKAEVGYIDYARVLENYPAAQQAVKELDQKGLELQQFMLEKEKQYKGLSTPLQKQNFESQTANELRTRQEALARMQQEKEDQILQKVQAAARSVMVAQKLDAVLADQIVFVGGVDVTDQVLQQLKGQ